MDTGNNAWVGTLKRVEMTAALGSGSTPRPSLPQPCPRAPRLILGSAPSRFEATSQPSSGRPKAADLRPNPLTGMAFAHYAAATGDACRFRDSNPNPKTFTPTLRPSPQPEPEP